MTDRLRVLLVSGSAPPVKCGVGDYTACLARSLAAGGDIDVGLLTTRGPDRSAAASTWTDVELLEPVEHWTFGDFTAARQAIDRHRPDILHLQYPAQGYDGSLPTLLSQWFRRRIGRPVVTTLHEHILPHRVVKNLMVQSASAVISVRPNFRDAFRRGFTPMAIGKPFHFIPNASSVPRAERTDADVADVRERFAVRPGAAIVAYFGLLYPTRGALQLFDIADPSRHHLVIVGETVRPGDDYGRQLRELADSDRWRGAVTFTGFLPEDEAARTLAAADAVVLPFTHGGGVWNTSIHAARLQETFVLTTSTAAVGYDPVRNLFLTRPGDIPEMRRALAEHLGTRRPGSSADVPKWRDIADQHRRVYAGLAGRRP